MALRAAKGMTQKADIMGWHSRSSYICACSNFSKSPLAVVACHAVLCIRLEGPLSFQSHFSGDLGIVVGFSNFENQYSALLSPTS